MTPSPAAQKLYLDAFPQNERRDLKAWVALADAEGPFRIQEWQWQGQFAGFLTHWTFPGFTYVEHFAAMPELRGQGIGGKWLDNFVAHTAPTYIVPRVISISLPTFWDTATSIPPKSTTPQSKRTTANLPQRSSNCVATMTIKTYIV